MSAPETAYPIGYPAPEPNRLTQSPKIRPLVGSGDTKDVTPPASSSGTARAAGRAAGAERKRLRGPGTAGLLELSRLVSDRDIAVLQELSDHRFLTTLHIQGLLFHDHATALTAARTCRRVLRRLEKWGLLERPLRRIGGLQAGSASSVWMVSSPGRRLLNLRGGVGAVGRVREPGEAFVRHYLDIADAHLALLNADRAGSFELLDIQTEPHCWRSHVGLGGTVEVLKPDLFVIAAGPLEEAHYYLEIDRGTESLPTVVRQCRRYESYRRTGQDQDSTGLFPRVLWLAPSERRATKIREAIDRDPKLDADLFLVARLDAVAEVVARDVTDDGGGS